MKVEETYRCKKVGFFGTISIICSDCCRKCCLSIIDKFTDKKANTNTDPQYDANELIRQRTLKENSDDMISINTDLGNHKTRSRQTDIETHRTEVLVTEAPFVPPVVPDRTPTPVATRYVINKKEAAIEAKKNSA